MSTRATTQHRSVQCDVDWQVLRVGTLPRYNSLGGWDTPDGTVQNLSALRIYHQCGYYISHQEYQRRIYRVRSLLLTVLRQYREADKVDTKMYTMVLRQYTSMPGAGRVETDSVWWHRARIKLVRLLRTDPDTYNNVRREIGGHLRSAQGDVSALQEFYDLMQEVA